MTSTMVRPNSRVLSAIRESPWAILPSKLAEISELVRLHAAGVRYSEEEIRTLRTERREPYWSVEVQGDRVSVGMAGQNRAPASGSIAVLPLFGTLVPRANLMSERGMGVAAASSPM